MKVSFISGINYPQFSEQGGIAFTLCDFILKSKEYTDYYRDNNQYKITDNMAAEVGVSSDVEVVLQAARDVDSNEIWASDKLFDKDETIRLTEIFLSHLTSEDKLRFNIVGVPQGKNLQEWLECYEWMRNNTEIHVIALSKYSVPEAFAELAGTNTIGKARPFAVRYLHARNMVTKPLHLAGADNFIINEIKQCKRYPMVRSIDSNIAFKLGVMGHQIDNCEIEPEERLNHDIKELTQDQLELIQYNINRVKEVIN